MTITASTRSPLRSLARDAALDAAAVLLPVRCAGCSAPDRSLCTGCLRRLEPDPRSRVVRGIPVWSALDYEDVPRAVLLAYKDAGRVDVSRALGRALRAALGCALGAEAADVSMPSGAGARRSIAPIPVLIPSTRAAWRRRGYHPTARALAHSRALAPPLWRALRLTRQTADQAGLAGAERAANRAGSMIGSPRLRGRECVIVDDIVTSGATLVEAARAIREAGGTVYGAATIARTPRRRS